MDKWPGGQNGGNHFHRTEYRKKSEKKWRQPKRHLGSWETKEKVQKMFTKDLQELKNKQREVNNAWDGIKSRVTEAEVPEQNVDKGYIVIKLTKIKDKDKILKVTREKWQHKREFSSGYQLISQQKLYKPEGNDTVC